ncbi:hypothetical protein GLOIN_2v1470195 [Rhizophagus irregularis DAOM 181602=DAOM 197198]|nr:hypothetical protein GLOIN_2v1470195 [Rhizophagus irregularis DAOM 181602=DAOM 197198]
MKVIKEEIDGSVKLSFANNNKYKTLKTRLRTSQTELKTSISFMMDLPIIVDTSQQPFSSWMFPKIKLRPAFTCIETAYH